MEWAGSHRGRRQWRLFAVCCLPVADDLENVYFTRQNTRNTAKHDGVTGNVLATLRIKIYR